MSKESRAWAGYSTAYIIGAVIILSPIWVPVVCIILALL